MGCGSSRSVSAIQPRPASVGTNLKSSSTKNNKVVPNTDSRVTISNDNNHNIIHVSPGNSLTDVINISSAKRDISASSTRTADSGISELKEEVITENSNSNGLEQIKTSERPITPELILEGRACPRLQSGKEKRRFELEKKNSESSIPKFPPLGNGCLLERPTTRGGISFDVFLCPETGNIKKAPTNLQKLERRKRRKQLTKEELEEKMRKATERRQEHRRKIIEKSQAFLGHYGNSDHTNGQLQQHTESQGEDNLGNGQEIRDEERNSSEDHQDIAKEEL